MLFGRHRKTEESSIDTVITIGSARVTGSLISTTRGGTHTIHYTSVSAYPLQDELDTERFTKAMLSALVEVAMDVAGPGRKALTATLGKRPMGSVTCVFTAPWFAAQTRRVSMKRQKDFVVRAATIRELMEQEIAAFKDGPHDDGSTLAATMEHASVMDAEVIRTEVNGYATVAPEGKEAHMLTLTLYASVMSSAIIEKVRDIIAKTFHAESPTFLSSSLICYQGIERHLRPPENYTIIEIHGEITDVSLVTDGILLESSSFPQGNNSIIRAVATKLKRRQEDVKTRIALMAQGKAERTTPEAKEIESATYTVIADWIDGLYRALKVTSEGRPVPQTTYLLVDPEWELFFSTALTDQAFELFTFSDRPFSVVPINARTLRGACSAEDPGIFVPLTALSALTSTIPSTT